MRHALMTCLMLGLATLAHAAGMDSDPEAKALRQHLAALAVAGVALRDDLNTAAERRLAGPVTMGPGVKAREDPADRAACFPEDRSEALYVYYGLVLPRRARLSLDFRVDGLPREHSFMTICSAGTAGNTKFTIRLGLDRRVSVNVLTPREGLNLLSDPVALGRWHRLEWWYAPEGALLIVDGSIADYATDYGVPYAVQAGEAFYLGDQPWWDAGAQKGIFYPLDSFVGSLDNLELLALRGES